MNWTRFAVVMGLVGFWPVIGVILGGWVGLWVTVGVMTPLFILAMAQGRQR
jgi:hypothetical protein